MAHLTVHDGVIDYADGGENKLLSIVSDPAFDEQQTYRSFTKEWNVYYHLSPLRKNVFAWLDFPEGSSMLELGAGCGAATTFLATIPRSRVVAVEGSVARAKVIGARCAGFDNVEVHACDLNRFESDERFDFVTLIGVLEYAGKFQSGPHPFGETLLKARRFLKENGTLLIAIENRMGHKYLAGLAEDHYGEPFEGINNYPRFNGVRTFDRAELAALCDGSGFASTRFFYPFPDYKLPVLILSEAAFSSPGFDTLALFNLPSRDHVAAKKPLFNEAEFLASVHRLGCAPMFMNSFLVFASPSPQPAFVTDPKTLAVRLNTVRVPPFSTRVIFYKHESGLRVKKERIGSGVSAGEHRELCVVHNPDADNGEYLSGFRSLEDKVVEALTKNDNTEVLRLLLLWISTLYSQQVTPSSGDIDRFESFCMTVFNRSLYTHAYDQPWVDGRSIDLIPRNVIENESKTKTVIIDKEWAFSIHVPLQLVFDRALFHFQTTISSASGPLAGYAQRFIPLPPDVMAEFESHPLFLRYDKQCCRLFERWFQNFVMSSNRAPAHGANVVQHSPVTGVSIIVPVFNKVDLTRQFLDSFQQRLPRSSPFEVIIVDNASTDGTAAFLSGAEKNAPWLRIITRPENGGYGAACNAGAAAASFSHLLFMNNDILFLPRWFEPLAGAFLDPDVGIAGSRLIFPNFTIQHAGVVFQENRLPFHISRDCHFSAEEVCAPKAFAAVTGACLMIPALLFRELSGFDHAFQMYYEDIDLCLKVHRHKKRVLYIPESMLVHLEGKSSGSLEEMCAKSADSMPVFLDKWGGYLSKAIRKEPELFFSGSRYQPPINGRERPDEPSSIQTHPHYDTLSLRRLISTIEFCRGHNSFIPAYDILVQSNDLVRRHADDPALKSAINRLQEQYETVIASKLSGSRAITAAGDTVTAIDRVSGGAHPAVPGNGRRRPLRVLFQNRGNAFDKPGGDTVVMARLKGYLEQQGVCVDFSANPDIDLHGAYDLVHLFNSTLPATTDLFAINAVRNNKPFVMTTLQENFPLYYHKAVTAFSWFRTYVTGDAEVRGFLPLLQEALVSVQPIPLITSPFAGNAACALFACGESEAAFLRSTFPSSPIDVVPFGSSVKNIDVPGSLFEQAFGVKNFVFCVGRVEMRKNQLMLLHALEESDLPVVFADGGFAYNPEYASLCKIFKRKGRIVFTGRLSDELLVSAYRSCRLHCLPSWYELPGLVSLEASRYGCATVASSWGGLPDYLGSVCEYCAPDDPASIRAAVLNAFESGPRKEAAERARLFTWERFGELTLRGYDRVLQEYRGFAPAIQENARSGLRTPGLPQFMSQIVRFVEGRRIADAMRYYDSHRKSFSSGGAFPELIQMDTLMRKLKKSHSSQ
ncbi:MAG: glycosyltransferase [Chitinispirillaceae bacterium]|nr:glycosyltransferase [Chitinispirillaceae bacterium]